VAPAALPTCGPLACSVAEKRPRFGERRVANRTWQAAVAEPGIPYGLALRNHGDPRLIREPGLVVSPESSRLVPSLSYRKPIRRSSRTRAE
jgi:hypothetical protein